LGWGDKFALLYDKLWLRKNNCFHKNRLTCNVYRKVWWISTENFWVKSFLFLVFCRHPKEGTICIPLAHSGNSRKKVGAESFKYCVSCTGHCLWIHIYIKFDTELFRSCLTSRSR
jgi:hypothetical protein